MRVNCIVCSHSFEAKRSDAKTCSDKCRVKLSNLNREVQEKNIELADAINIESKKREENFIAQIRVLEGENVMLKEKVQNLIDKKEFLMGAIQKAKIGQIEIGNKIRVLKNTLSQKDTELYYGQNQDKIFFYKATIFHEYIDRVEIEFVKKYRKQLQNELITLKDTLQQLQSKESLLKNEFENIPTQINHCIEFCTLNNSRLIELDKLRFQPQKPILSSENQLSISKPIEPDIKNKQLTGKDLLNMNFNTFTLQTEMGRFLGNLDRNKLAFALTGDSGSGKSYFSFALAKLFMVHHFSVKYFSLEEGIGQLAKEKIQLYQLDDLQISGDGSLKEVRKTAKEYDVIIVDSFQKLNCKPEEYDKLRKDFPNTIFICIFQKTTNNTIRGGSQIFFDSSAVINIEKRDDKRIAVMQKSRYGTANWEYDIEAQKVN